MRVGAGLGIMFGALVTAPALAQGITKTEMRSQSNEATARELRDQMWAMFEPQSRRSKAPPRALLEHIFLDTPAYPSSVPGICRQDSVMLHFAPVDPGERNLDADTPVRARGIEAYANYRRVSPIRDNVDRSDPWFHIEGRRACAGLKDARFFTDESDDDAEATLRLADAVVAALDSGSVVPTCGGKSLGPGETCAGVMKGLNADDLSFTRACHDQPGGGQRCTQLEIGSYTMSVRWRFDAGGNHVRILAVEPYDEIVIADSVAD
jgi:hypothetical protein